MGFCTNCGQELSQDAHFCPNCGEPVKAYFRSEPAPRKTTYEGQLHKCPNCGEVLDAFSAKCPACGYELRGVHSAYSVEQLCHQLNASCDVRQMAFLIQNYPIPNTKEDILEFLIMAESNFGTISISTSLKERVLLYNAWLSKLEQCRQKAMILFSNDPALVYFQQIYSQAIQNIEEAKAKEKRRRTCAFLLRNAAMMAGMIGLIIALYVDRAGANAAMISLLSDIVLITVAVTAGKWGASMLDFAFGALCGLACIGLSFLFRNGSLQELTGGIVLIAFAANFFRAAAHKNE